MSKKSLILSLLLIISCTDNPTESSNKKENLLMPLSIGNSWMYEVKQYSIFSETYREEVWVVEDTVILQGQEYYLIGVGGSPLKLLAANLDDGLFFSYYRQNSLYYPMFYKFPVSNSEIYEYNIPNTDSTITMEVKRINLEVNSSIYECFVYTNLNWPFYFPSMYFSPNVGLIRKRMLYAIDYFIGDTTKPVVWSIKSFSLE